jgi:hypothetical protein
MHATFYRTWKCKECHTKYHQEYRTKNKEKIKQYDRNYKKVAYDLDESYRQRIVERVRRGRQKYRVTIEKARRQLKIDAINAYGGRCACCGVDNYEFMAIDHIHGNGNKHRKDNKTGGGQQFYRWLKKQNYPSGFRVLCHNCNMSYGLYRYCPHNDKDRKYGENCYKV